MLNIPGQDEVSVLKHILCSLMDMSDFLYMKTFNTVIIKTLECSLQLIENVPV